MKKCQPAGPTGFVSEMLKAANESSRMLMTDVFNTVVTDGKIPQDPSRS